MNLHINFNLGDVKRLLGGFVQHYNATNLRVRFGSDFAHLRHYSGTTGTKISQTVLLTITFHTGARELVVTDSLGEKSSSLKKIHVAAVLQLACF